MSDDPVRLRDAHPGDEVLALVLSRLAPPTLDDRTRAKVRAVVRVRRGRREWQVPAVIVAIAAVVLISALGHVVWRRLSHANVEAIVSEHEDPPVAQPRIPPLVPDPFLVPTTMERVVARRLELPYAHAERETRVNEAGALVATIRILQPLAPLPEGISAIVWRARTATGTESMEDDFDCRGTQQISIPRAVFDAARMQVRGRNVQAEAVGIFRLDWPTNETVFVGRCALYADGTMTPVRWGESLEDSWRNPWGGETSRVETPSGPREVTWIVERALVTAVDPRGRGTYVAHARSRDVREAESGARIALRSGSVAMFPSDVVVMTVAPDGSSQPLAASALTPGQRVVGTGGRIDTILAVSQNQADRRSWSDLDLVGAVAYVRDGIVIYDRGPRDDLPAAATVATPTQSSPFSVESGPGECGYSVRWRLADSVVSSAGGRVGVSMARAPSSRNARADARCTELTASVEIRGLTALARLPGAEAIELQVNGVECSTDYFVSRCVERDGARTPLPGSALSVLTSPYCLAEGTLVETPSGPVAIERLRAGDVVVGVRGEHLIDAPIHDVIARPASATLILRFRDGTSLEATPEHIVATPFGWRRVSELIVGSVLVAAAPERDPTIVAIEPHTSRTIELRVASPDTYIANGIIVHNY